MKQESETQLPGRALNAFEDYPELAVYPAFNRAVLERLELESMRRRGTWRGQIEEWLGLELWQFAASGLLGAFLPAIFLGLLFFTQSPQETVSKKEIPPAQLQALGPFYAREWERQLHEEPSASVSSSASQSSQREEISCLNSASHWAYS